MPTQKLGLMQKATHLEARGPLAEGKRKVHALAPGVTWLCECQAKRIASLSPGLQKSPKPKASLQCPSPRQEGHSQSHCGHHVDPVRRLVSPGHTDWPPLARSRDPTGHTQNRSGACSRLAHKFCDSHKTESKSQASCRDRGDLQEGKL